MADKPIKQGGVAMRPRQHEIITALGAKPHIHPKEALQQRTDFLVDYLEESGATGFALGISGGQDSLLAGMLAQDAVRRRRALGHKATFHALLLPYGTQRDRADAELALEVIQPDVTHDINIKPAVDAMVAAVDTSSEQPVSDFNKGNIKARQRMIAQYAIAAQYGLLVVGTDHAAEALTGFFTKYGDGGVDIQPLAGLTKRQGKALLQELGVPELFTSKPPTADLLDEQPERPDETELGVSYEVIDDYLEGRAIDPALAMRIEQQYDATQHKRALPPQFSAL